MAYTTLAGASRRLAGLMIAGALFMTPACNRDSGTPVARDDFLGVGEEAELALSSAVDFRLTDAILTSWERAQVNLERIPTRELRGSNDRGATDPIARAVNRLTSNGRSRVAIESAGISVKDYVLATIALAQALQATDPASRRPAPGVPAENIAFVLARRSRLTERAGPPRRMTEGEIAESESAAMRNADSAADAVVTEPATPPEPPVPTSGGQPIVPASPPTDTLSDSLTSRN